MFAVTERKNEANRGVGAALMLPQSASFSTKANCRSTVQPSWRARTGTSSKVISRRELPAAVLSAEAGLCSDIVLRGRRRTSYLMSGAVGQKFRAPDHKGAIA